jgi:surface polysaccharide O-acyltransferase-like enzyme
MQTSPIVNSRDAALDGMRVVATLFVITIHVCAQGFAMMGQKNWWAINAYDSISRVAVPLFFMVTGALLLPRTHTIASIGRRQWRIAVPLLAWSVIYLLWLHYANQPQHDWFSLVLARPSMPHLWYLYALAGAYVFLPVLAAFHQTIPVRTQLFCLLFWFIAASVVPLEVTLTGSRHVGIDWSALPLYPGYMAIGALLYWHLPALPRRAVVAGAGAAWLVLAVAIAVATWWRGDQLAQADETFYLYSSPLVVLAAIAAFVFLRALAARMRPGSTVDRACAAIAGLTFGVYLSHVVVLFVLADHGIHYHFVTPWIAIPVVTLLAGVLSALMVRLLQAVPLVRAIVPC